MAQFGSTRHVLALLQYSLIRALQSALTAQVPSGMQLPVDEQKVPPLQSSPVSHSPGSRQLPAALQNWAGMQSVDRVQVWR